MAKGSSFIDDWIEEGEARGEANEARRLAERILTRRFGPLPESLTHRIQAGEREWCEDLAIRASEVESLEELDWER